MVEMIKPATLADVDAMTEIQLLALPDSLISKCGANYLKAVFFPAVLRSPHCFTVIHELENQAKSFAVFALNSRALSKAVMENKRGTILSILPRLMRDRRLLFSIIAYTCFRKIALREEIENSLDLPELYVFATHPSEKGKGYGSRLLEKGLQTLFKQKKDQIGCLVRTPSSTAHSYYLRRGFSDIGVETVGKSKKYMLLYRF